MLKLEIKPKFSHIFWFEQIDPLLWLFVLPFLDDKPSATAHYLPLLWYLKKNEIIVVNISDILSIYIHHWSY